MANKTDKPISRRQFFSSAAAGSITGLAALNNPFMSLTPNIEQGPINKEMGGAVSSAPSVEPNMIGAYGPWASKMYGDQPARLSLRNDRWEDTEAWRKEAHARFKELLAQPDTGGTPEVTVISTHSYDGLTIEKLSWQLPYGPATEAFFVKPEGATGPLPGVVALHDHGANKYFGKRKITQIADDEHPMIPPYREIYYGGRAWVNALAKQGFAVLVPDAFAFASRRVLLQDVSPSIQRGHTDVSADEGVEEINAYNDWAVGHEHIMSKSLFCAGTTWPGVFVSEDQRALDVLAARPEVDENNMGCCGLSGGGLRTLMLSGIDSRIKSSVCVGMMSTWKDFLMYTSFTHTWMIYVPHLPQEMDFSEILTLQMPASRMVLNNTEDQLFDIDEMRRSDRILKENFEKAGAGDKYVGEFYPGEHKFDLPMQESAFNWLKKWLA